MKLEDLRELCDRYVPANSRHENSLRVEGSEWWPAHELGHLIVAAPNEIGRPLFGLEDSQDYPFEGDARRHAYLLTVERAAMTVSRRLLVACGREDIADDELEDTDYDTVEWDPRGRVTRRLRRLGVERIPRTRARLEKMLIRKLRSASRVITMGA